MKTYLEDKYFRDLDNFNKVVVPHKLSFFQNIQGLSFFNFLSNLSYNLNYKSSNYRWGKRFFSQDYNDFKWITSTNKKITTSFWNSSEHCYEQKEINAYFTEKILASHFLSCFLKNRKIKFFYKLSDYEKNELKNHDLALSNMYRVDGKTFGSTQQLNSDILLIDIDNYEERSAIETLSMFLDYVELNVSDLLYIEQNVFTGGIHTALKLPQKITNEEFYSSFMKHLKENDITIECNFINNILRFPLSFEYVAIKHNESILNYNEFIPSNLWEETFDSYLNNMNLNPCNSKVINEFIAKIHNNNLQENRYENYWKQKKHIILRNKKICKSPTKKLDFYGIENGNRYDTMSKLIPYCKMHGLSLDETVETIFKQNISSKDLAKWSYDKLKNNIKKFYNNCSDEILSYNSTNEFISNIQYLPKSTNDFLDNETFKKHITDRFIRYYIEERNKHNANIKNLSKEKTDILYKQIPYMIKEIIGKMIYDINNKKTFVRNNNIRLGFQLSDAHLKAIQEQSIKDLGIDSPLAKTSIQYLKKAILKALSLQEIKYNNRKKNWMLGSCKSFEISSINDLYQLLEHLYRSTFKINPQKTFYNIIILYILLNRNYGLLEYVEDDVPKNST